MARSRIFLFSLLSLIGGIFIRSFFALPIFLWWIVALGGVSVVLAGFRKVDTKWVGIGLCAISLSIGFLRYAMVEKQSVILPQGQVEFVGSITDEPKIQTTSQQFTVKTDSALFRVTARSYPRFEVGDKILVRGIIKEPENFGGFDYKSYLSKEGIIGIMSFPAIEKQGTEASVFSPLFYLKSRFERNIEHTLPEPHSGLLRGLLLGGNTTLPVDLIENFKRTGTTHIIAISGYNISLVARFFLAVLLFLTLPFSLAFWVATLGIVFFVILTGASASVVRAGVMGILVLLAQREGRMYHMTNALIFTAALMVFQNPKILRFDIAFQLSFLATAGLVYLAPHVEENLLSLKAKAKFLFTKQPDTSRFQKPIGHTNLGATVKNILIETLSAQIFVLPFLVYTFGTVSLISPLTNILVLLAVPYAMALGFLEGLISFFSLRLGVFLGWLNWFLLEYVLKVIQISSRFPLAAIDFGKGVVLVFGLYVILFAYLVKKHRNKKRYL